MAAPQSPRWRTRPDVPVVRASPGIGPIVIIIGLAVAPIGLAIGLDGSTYDTWGAYIWGPVLLALAYPLCRFVANRTGEPEIAGFLFGAAALKIVVGAVVRYYMAFSYYDNSGDAGGYDTAGAALAEPFRRGVFEDLGQITATRFIGVLNGLVQAVIGQTRVGTFLVFSAFGFVGMCLLYMAFCLAQPNGDRTLYRRLLFLTPTMWFWPSSVGKDAFLLLCLGAAAYGFASVLAGHMRGVVFGGLGLWGIAVVRPHIALMLLIGVLAAIPATGRAGSSESRSRARRAVARIIAIGLLVLALPVVLNSLEGFLGIDGLNVESVTEAREQVSDNTAQGGSEFEAPNTSTPGGFVLGVATIAVRPFLWEADGVQLFAALEALVLGAIYVVVIFRRGTRWLRALVSRWCRFSGAYVLAFAWAFSAVANFGILVRQRSLALPLLFVLIAAAPRRPTEADESGGVVKPAGVGLLQSREPQRFPVEPR